MRTPALLPLLALLLTACRSEPGAVSGDAGTEVEAQLRTASAALTEAMNSGDAEAVFAFYREDPSFVYLGCTEYIIGGQSFRRMVGPYYGRVDHDTFEFQVMATQALGLEAGVISLQGSSTSSPALFVTQVWAKEGGEWRITMVHESWPGCREPRPPHPFTEVPGSAPDDPGPSGG